MIALLTGTAVAPDIIDVAGVGYQVHCPEPLVVGQAVTVHVLTVVRQDAITLYGFASRVDQDVFAALTRVSGIGPRMAMEVLATVGVGGLVRAVQAGDVGALTRAKGVGRKAAQMMVATVQLPASALELDAPGEDASLQDAQAALRALGIAEDDAARYCRAAVDELGADAASAELVRTALRLRTA